MPRRTLCVLVLLLCAAPFSVRANTIINLNATTPGNTVGGIPNSLSASFFQTLTLGPGTYDLSVVGSGTPGALYNGWSQSENPTTGLPSDNGWQERIGFDLGYASSFFTTGALNEYDYADTLSADQFLFRNGNCNQGNCYASATAALAAFAPQTYQFTLTGTTLVTFYIPDTPASVNGFGFTDNTGGESLALTQVTPEPSSLLLLGTGIFLAAYFSFRPIASMNLPVPPDEIGHEKV